MISQEEPGRIPLGMAPAILAKRRITKPSPWCPKTDIDFDKYCDPDYPKIITYNDVWFATTALWKDIPKTPLVRSKYCVQFGLELNYKFETLHKTGSFHDRAALYCLRKLKKSQRANGIYTASLGNWAMAVAYHAHISHTPLTVVLPEDTMESIVENCQKFGANVVIHGKNLDEAKKQAFVLMAENGTGVFINGYDHPNVIAAAGTIGIEILEDLPQTDAILVPVGGGALLAGITAAVKHLKPSILVYGVEPHKCCCFFKAMENERPYRTEPEECIASSLGVPTVGANSFHTARSLIDKMVLVDDDWITRAILHLSEEEKYVVDGAGACPLSAILALEDILPELKDKTVVCVVTSGNINLITLTRAIERAKAIEGRIIKITVCIDPDTDDTKLLHRILSVIANVGCSVRDVYRCNSWFDESEFTKILQTIICETKNLRHACTLKRVLEKLFPNICDFYDEPYNPIPKCPCYPEDFDEFCDPDCPRELKLEDVSEAAEIIKPHIIKTKCFPAHRRRQFGMNLYFKPEMFQRSGSFKERGSVNALQHLSPDKKKIGVVIAALGNEALGLCYHASKMNMPVIVVMPTTVPLSKIQKCHSYGAKVLVQGTNLLESQKYARAVAREKGLTYINGRDHPHVLAGYGTIALEILEQIPQVDAIIVPTGTGGLLAAIATVVKQLSPKCLVYGVQPENLSSFFHSLQNGTIGGSPMGESIADSIAVPNVGVNAFANAENTVDKMLLVSEDWIAKAMMHLVDKERLIVEGAGACTMAAIMGSLVPELKLKNVVCILSGGNVDSIVFHRCLDRGMASEGRLVKFSIAVKDNIEEKQQLMNLLAKGGFNVIRHFQERPWISDDIYRVGIQLTCEAKGLEHALELKRLIDKAYPCTALFETEPFNDKRACPCYVRKFM